jgi:signal transduction histidine kinase
MDRMATSGNYLALSRRLRALRADWPALLLPVIAVGTLGLIDGSPFLLLLVIVSAIVAPLAPKGGAKIVPFAFFGYGAYGVLLAHFLETGALAHFLQTGAAHPVLYGLVQVGPADNAAWVLPEAFACLVTGVWLLAVTGAPGAGAVRRAVDQLRGTGGRQRTVPPLLLLPVLFLWEEMFSQQLWFGAPHEAPSVAAAVCAALILIASVAVLTWLPRAAVVIAVAGTVLLGTAGLMEGLHGLWASGHGLAPGGVVFYGAVPIGGGLTGLFAAVQGSVLLAFGCVLAPRVLTLDADADSDLARHAQALARRVEGLTQSRTDATEVAVAELRRIERDLHDGAQARLVAVGMSLRAAEQLMTANPEAARALVAEARETSSRAIDDLRDLVRGIYPPVLADRGLADAVRALALDAVLDVDVDVDLPGEPPMPVAAAVYFAVAEALTNAARHAGACAVRLSVEHVAGMLRATVTDDGHGGADAVLGTGLAGVERRLATFDGILAVSSPVGGPTIVVIEVPCALSSVKISSS